MVTFLTADLTTTYTLAAEEDLVLAPGVLLTSSGSGFAVAAGDNSGHILTIHGSVLANNTGLNLTRNSNTLPFSNAVSVGPGGIVQSLNGDAIVTNSNLIRITNHGLIETVSTSTSNQALDLFANSVIVNTGTISAFTSDAIRVAPTAFADSTGPQHLDNSGTIAGGANGLNYAGMWLTGTNSGLISGGNIGIVVSGTLGLMIFTNSGRIDGRSGIAISASVGDDLIRNSGTIDGDVMLGGGADLCQGRDTGLVNGVVLGEDGADVLAGAAAADDLDGGNDDDLVTGGGGDDRLLGQAGNDELRGGDGDDDADGGDGNDGMRGGAGDDRLTGAAGADGLSGGLGEDILIGGLGTDRLTGGGDADTFVWTGKTESRVGSLRDIVTDFQAGLDLIDLDKLMAGKIAFLGTAAFTATAIAELNLTVTAAGHTIVAVDTDGNGSADFEIELRGATGVSEADFAL